MAKKLTKEQVEFLYHELLFSSSEKEEMAQHNGMAFSEGYKKMVQETLNTLRELKN